MDDPIFSEAISHKLSSRLDLLDFCFFNASQHGL
jgi:hypothetical protein